MRKKDYRFHHTLQVRWSECDAQGIVFNAEYLNYIEIAQVEYYRNLGILLYDERSREYFDIATVKATLEYKASARLDDLLDISMKVSRMGNTSISMDVEICRHGSRELLTSAEIIYVTYDSRRSVSRRLPEDVRKVISHFEETGEVLPTERLPGLTMR